MLYEVITVIEFADGDWLKKSVLFDGMRKLGQAFLGEYTPRLIWIGSDIIDRNNFERIVLTFVHAEFARHISAGLLKP